MARATLLVIAALALAAPSAALAHGHGGTKHLPPGNPAANEYTESLPTAGGSTPSGGPPSGGTPSGGASIPRSTLTQLNHSGAAGKHAAALASDTAASSPRARRKFRSGQLNGPTSSAAGQVIKTLSGAGASGGLGVLLPMILIVSLLGASALGILRRRGPA